MLVWGLLGDLLLFNMARKLGPAAFARKPFSTLLPQQRRERIQRLFRRHGGRVVFVARHLAGLRAAVFAMAGIEGLPLARFVLWDALGLCISAPLMIGLGYLFSDQLDRVRQNVARGEHYLILLAALAFVVYLVWGQYRRHGPDRRHRPPH